MSNLFVDKISGKSGTSSGAPITLSGDTATLGSGVTIPAAGITGTLGSGVFPAGHVINIETTYLPTQDYASTQSDSYSVFWSPTYTPQKNNSKIYAWLHLQGEASHAGNWKPIWQFKYSVSGDDITNLTDVTFGTRGWQTNTGTNSATATEIQHMDLLRPVTLDGTGTATITYALYFKNNNSEWYSHTLRIYGYTSGADYKGSSITFQEIAQ